MAHLILTLARGRLITTIAPHLQLARPHRPRHKPKPALQKLQILRAQRGKLDRVHKIAPLPNRARLRIHVQRQRARSLQPRHRGARQVRHMVLGLRRATPACLLAWRPLRSRKPSPAHRKRNLLRVPLANQAHARKLAPPPNRGRLRIHVQRQQVASLPPRHRGVRQVHRMALG